MPAFEWNEDNWSFTNTTSTKKNGELISAAHIEKLKEGLSNTEHESLFGKNGYFNQPADDHSYGMCAVMLLAKQGLLPFGEFKDGAENLYALEETEEIRSLITYYDAQRYKDVYMQNLVETMNRSDRDNNMVLIELMENSTVKNGMVLFSYSANGGAPHTVIAYGISNGDFKIDGLSYNTKMSIYNPEAPNESDCLYLKSDGSGWMLSMKDKAPISKINASICYIDDQLDYGSMNYAFVECDNINDKNMSFQLNSENLKSETLNGNYCYFVQGAGSECKIEQIAADDLDAMIRYNDSMFSAGSNGSAKITFNRDDHFVSVTADEAASYSFSMTFNEAHPWTNWFTVRVSGSAAKKAVLKAVKDGYVLTTDTSLIGITVEADGTEPSAAINFSTDFKEVLIYQIDEQTLGVKADADGDGIYETEIPTAQKLLGDVNEDGKIDSVDAAEILVAAASKGAGGEGLSETLAQIADVNLSGDYDATDAALILQFAAYAGAGGTASLPEFINSLA